MKKTVALVFPLFIAACGGGGGSSDNGGEEPSPSRETVSESLTLGESQDFELITKDKGFYSLAVKAGESYSIDVINMVYSDNLIGVTFNNESAILTPRLMASFDYNATQDEDVIVTVDGSSSASFNYRIDAHLSTESGLLQDNMTYEPNNSKNASYPVLSGTTYSSGLAQYDDFDWYSLDVVGGDTVTLNVSNSINSVAFLHVQAFNNDGSPLSQVYTVSHTKDLNEELTVRQTGKVFVKLEGQSSGADFYYDLTLSLTGLTN